MSDVPPEDNDEDATLNTEGMGESVENEIQVKEEETYG
jgi:hypothetical protein